MVFKLRRKNKKRLGVYRDFEEEVNERNRETVSKSYTYGLMLREIYRGDNTETLNQIVTRMSKLKTTITEGWLRDNYCKLDVLESRVETLERFELCTGKELNLDCLQFNFREDIVPARSNKWNKRVYFGDFKEWKEHMDEVYVGYWDWLDYTRSAYGEVYHINQSTPLDHAMYLKATFIKYAKNFKNPKSMTDVELRNILERVMGFDFIMKMLNSIPTNVSSVYREVMNNIDRNTNIAKAYIKYKEY